MFCQLNFLSDSSQHRDKILRLPSELTESDEEGMSIKIDI